VKMKRQSMSGGFPNQQMPMHEETVVELTVAPSCISTPLLRSIGHQ
jgi:hypothetical protein